MIDYAKYLTTTISLFALASMLMLESCRKEPSQWNADYLFPVVEDELSLENLIADSNLSTSGGAFVLDYKQEVSRFDLNNIVEIPDTAFIESYSLPFNSTINPGFEFVNEVQNQSLSLSAIELKKVVASQGKIRLQLENPYETTVFYTLRIPGVSKDGVPYEIIAPAEPGSISSPSITSVETSLEGYEFDLRGVAGDEFNKLQTQVAVQTDPNGTSVQSTPNHITRVRVFFEDVKAEYARGYFGQQIFQDTFSVDLNSIFNINGGFIDLEELDLTLSLLNGVKVDGVLEIQKVSGRKEDGQVLNLSHPDIGKKRNINRATGNASQLNVQSLEYSFNEGNSNIVDMVEFLPQTLEVIYSFELNPNGNISGHFDEFYKNSFIAFNVDLELPLTFGLDNFALSDTIDLDLSAAGNATAAIKSAVLSTQVKNAFPLSLLADVDLLDSLDEKIFVKKNIEILSAGLGVLSQEDSLYYGESNFDLDLSEALVDLNRVRKLRWSVRLSTDITSSGLVSLKPTDNAKLKANLKISYEHGED